MKKKTYTSDITLPEMAAQVEGLATTRFKGHRRSMVASCGKKRVSECWEFYAIPTARVIFTAKTSLDVFSLTREQV